MRGGGVKGRKRGEGKKGGWSSDYFFEVKGLVDSFSSGQNQLWNNSCIVIDSQDINRHVFLEDNDIYTRIHPLSSSSISSPTVDAA